MAYIIRREDKKHWQNIFDQVTRLQEIEALKPKEEIDNRPLYQLVLEQELEQWLKETQANKQTAKTNRKIIPFPKIFRQHH